MTAAIEVVDVAKRFRLYTERNQSLKVSLLRGRRAKYEEFWALNGVSLEVPQGSTFGLIGHNGSGKSTLLKCMARILQPDRGSITLNGRMSALLELGAGFHPELSGRENVYLNGSILGMPKKMIDQKFDDIVEFSGLSRFIDNPVKTYSSGMYVRLGFAVAISVEPEVLLVDEVLSVGDEEFQRRCAVRVRDLQQSGSTIVIVSHSLQTMRELCDNVAWLDSGEVRGLGKTQEVVDQYHAASLAHERERHEEAAEAGVEPQRGTMEAEILRAEATGPTGNAVVRSGETLRVRVVFAAPQPVERVRASVGLTSSAGVTVSIATTKEFGCDLDVVKGTMSITYEIPDVRLRAGSYDVFAGLAGSDDDRTIDVRPNLASFVVETDPVLDTWGVVDLAGRWLEPVLEDE